MYRSRVHSFNLPLVILHPGEFYSSSENLVISTVLGSCIAVALFDPIARIGGLNHFMLPGSQEATSSVLSPNSKYGMYAMELLINSMMKRGSRKSDLLAKVFGAASVLDLPERAGGNRIPLGNIEFTFSYLKGEGIPVAARDIGGTEPRKIFFFARTGRVLLKRITSNLERAFLREEKAYLAGCGDTQNV